MSRTDVSWSEANRDVSLVLRAEPLLLHQTARPDSGSGR